MAMLRLVDSGDVAPETVDTYDAAEGIADFLEGVAARLPVGDQVRTLALQNSDNWRTIAGCRPVNLTRGEATAHLRDFLAEYPPEQVGAEGKVD